MSVINIGVYCITCTANDRTYFGSSQDLKKRLYDHKRLLIKGKHCNRYLMSDWNLYGPDAFEFKVLIRHQLSHYKLLALETLFIHAYWDEQVYCYNSTYDARSTKGRVVSEETRAKISASLTGRKASDDAKLHQSEAKKGSKRQKKWTHSAEVRAKWSETRMGHVTSEETRSKQSTSNLGKKRSSETCIKVSQASKAAWIKKRLKESNC